MSNIWETIKLLLEKNVIKLLCCMVSVAEKIVDFMSEKRKDKLKQEAQKELSNAEKAVDQACDSGDLNDLFDAAAEIKRVKKKIKEAEK